MSHFASAKVKFIEQDFSRRAQDTSAQNILAVGTAYKGPLVPTVVDSPTQFRRLFGSGSDSTSFLYHAAQIITKFGALLCVRVVGDAARYAGISVLADDGMSGTTATQAWTTGISDLDSDYTHGLNEIFQIVAANPGAWANSDIKVIIIEYADYASSAIRVANPPQASDEFLILVYDAAGTILEEHRCTRSKTKSDAYGSMYVEDRINNNSQYIYIIDNEADTTSHPKSTKTGATITSVNLSQGVSDDSPTAGDILAGYNLCLNKNLYDIYAVLGCGNTDLSIQNGLITMVESRRDCIAYLDIPYLTADPAAAVTYRESTLNCSSNRVALYYDWQKAYDYETDKYIYLPPSIFVGAALAYMCKYGEPFNSPAGDKFGKIFDSVSARYDPTESDRDTLYSHQINPISTIKGLGRRIWGDKTQQKYLSSLSYIGCRIALDMIEAEIERVAMSLLFLPNNRTTRAMFEDAVNPFLRRMYERGALAQYIPCDVGDDLQTSEDILTAKIPVDLLESVQGIEVLVEIVRGNTTVNITELT